MAEFEAKVYKLEIEEHPNADVLELAKVGDYRSIVRKGDFKTGDLGVYIPEAAICPEWLIQQLGLEGRLAGKTKNRVKAVKLRGILSQGLIYPLIHDIDPEGNDLYSMLYSKDGTMVYELNLEVGQDVTELLGLKKYEPPIPVHMAGEVFNAHGYTLSYDIENFKKYPNIFTEGFEEVIMTEKLHGTWCCFGYHPDVDVPIVTSKGLSAKGLAFKFNVNNCDNLYMRTFRSLSKPDAEDGRYGEVMSGASVLDRAAYYWGWDEPFYILGEIYGKGVQDLTYGAETPQFRVFDVYWGEPGKGRYADADALPSICRAIEVGIVPRIFWGKFSKRIMETATEGKETVSDIGANIREGVVIRPIHERYDTELGRVILKSISETYLLRKGGTEYN